VPDALLPARFTNDDRTPLRMRKLQNCVWRCPSCFSSPRPPR